MSYDKIVIAFTVPAMNLQDVLDAAASAGAGVIGNYTHCSFRNIGTGRFKPDESANPSVGATGTINEVEEFRVETMCERSLVKKVCQAIRAAHPYEEPVIYLFPLLDENDFQ